MYPRTIWADHVTTPSNCYNITKNNDGTYIIAPAGTVMQQGTAQDQVHFNNMEVGIADSHIALNLLINALRQIQWESDEIKVDLDNHSWSAERGTVTLTNTLNFPFNNSQNSVALITPKSNTDYIILTEVVSANGNVGEIEISDKLTNGFKIAYTGSASSVNIKYTVIGGYLK